MAAEDRRLEELYAEIAEIKKSIVVISKYYPVIVKWVKEMLQYFRQDYVCADPHGTWDGHLPGAYSEGDQIENVLVSEGHGVTMERHPVAKDDFLTNLQSKYIVHLAGHGGLSGGQVKFCFDDADVYPSDISALASVPTLLFYAGVCLGGANDTMANAFRSKGTDCYVGFTQSIPDWDAKYFDDLVYEKWLVDGKSLATALDEADDSYPALSCWVLWD